MTIESLTWAVVRPARHGPRVVGDFGHLVVIYEENHSFDNLYGGWGAVGSG